jgi:hypothetical protein
MNLRKWWMCDMGMADPINQGMFWAAFIGTMVGIALAWFFLK